jgi:hypothetical protein
VYPIARICQATDNAFATIDACRTRLQNTQGPSASSHSHSAKGCDLCFKSYNKQPTLPNRCLISVNLVVGIPTASCSGFNRSRAILKSHSVIAGRAGQLRTVASAILTLYFSCAIRAFVCQYMVSWADLSRRFWQGCSCEETSDLCTCVTALE